MSLQPKKNAKITLPSDQKLAKVTLKHFGLIKQHLLECETFRDFVNQHAEDESEDMFEDEEGLDILGEDSDESEEEQLETDDENIDIDSDDQVSAKPPQKKSLPKKMDLKNGKSVEAASGKKTKLDNKKADKKPATSSKLSLEESGSEEETESASDEDSAESDVNITPMPTKKKNDGQMKGKAGTEVTPKNIPKKPAVATPHPKSAKKAETTPATGGTKRPQPGSDSKSTSLVKKVNLKDEKSLEAAPAKKAKLDVKNEDKKPATSSKFFVEHESDESESLDESADSDASPPPSKKKGDDGQTKGFWKGKIGDDKQKQDVSNDNKRGGMNRGGNNSFRGGDRGGSSGGRGRGGNFGNNDRGGRFSHSPRGGSERGGSDRGGRFNQHGNSSFRGGDRGGRGRGGFGGRGSPRGSFGEGRGRGNDRGGFGGRGRGNDRGGFGGRGSPRGGFGGRGRGNDRGDRGGVHPSWQAKQQQRQNQSGGPQGKRVAFDE